MTDLSHVQTCLNNILPPIKSPRELVATSSNSILYNVSPPLVPTDLKVYF